MVEATLKEHPSLGPSPLQANGILICSQEVQPDVDTKQRGLLESPKHVQSHVPRLSSYPGSL